MSHLSGEDLARLLEEEPRQEEADHLLGCGACSAELEALREQTRWLQTLPELEPPTASWRSLEAKLVGEGLLRPSRPQQLWGRHALRIAAALALFVGGGLTGALVRGVPAAGPAPTTAAATAEEAAARLRAAESAYVAAVARYAELTGAVQAVDPLDRLAALEGIVLTTRAALKEAPADPVINGYHLAALGQREALLRQIGQSPPQPEPTWY